MVAAARKASIRKRSSEMTLLEYRGNPRLNGEASWKTKPTKISVLFQVVLTSRTSYRART